MRPIQNECTSRVNVYRHPAYNKNDYFMTEKHTDPVVRAADEFAQSLSTTEKKLIIKNYFSPSLHHPDHGRVDDPTDIGIQPHQLLEAVANDPEFLVRNLVMADIFYDITGNYITKNGLKNVTLDKPEVEPTIRGSRINSEYKKAQSEVFAELDKIGFWKQYDTSIGRWLAFYLEADLPEAAQLKMKKAREADNSETAAKACNRAQKTIGAGVSYTDSKQTIVNNLYSHGDIIEIELQRYGAMINNKNLALYGLIKEVDNNEALTIDRIAGTLRADEEFKLHIDDIIVSVPQILR